MKSCPTCKSTYADDANFCPKESCATPTGPQRLYSVPAAAPVAAPTTSPVRPGDITADLKTRFQLGAPLGGSSTGEVYQALDTVTGAQVAYKIIASDVLPNAAAFARAEREFKQLMRVQSPRIAAVIDCGRTVDDRLFVALELCQGESLDKALTGTPVPLDRAKAMVAQIGQALLEAQKAGIVHRDVAPKNVLVTANGDVKVINFPLAKPVSERASGVAAYLSPEQVQGKPVDQRSNTYNLAAVLYHLLTGEPPFQGTPETVLDLHVSSPPLPPSQRRPEAGLPAEVDRVILKALDKSSSRRHLTLRLFLSEVEGLHMPVAAPVAAAPTREGPGGFARTMLFAGGQAEVANLVAKAIAARGSPAGGVPISQSPAPTASGTVTSGAGGPAGAVVTPALAPQTGRRHPSPGGTVIGHSGAGSNAALGTANTMAAVPTGGPGPMRLGSPAGGVPVAVSPAPSPASFAAEAQRNRANAAATPVVTVVQAPTASAEPVAPQAPAVAPASNVNANVAPTAPLPTQPSVAAVAQAPRGPGGGTPAATQPAAASKPASGKDAGKDPKGTAFRETLWFKKGDVEHMIAEARAKIASPEGSKAAEAPSPAEEVLPIEDRYADDGTLTADDRKKFSLRAGQTAASLPVVRGKVPGEAMSEADVIREVSGSRKGVVLLVAVVIVLAAAAAIVTLMRSKPTPVPALPPAASLISAPPAPSPSALAGAKADGPDEAPAAPLVGKGQKLVAAPPSKRSDGSDKRATRRKVKDRNRR